MKHLLLNLVVFLLVIQTGRSPSGRNISCYNCEGLKRHCTKATLKANPHKYLKDCSGVEDRCMRIWQKSGQTELVQNLCADEEFCDEMRKVCIKQRNYCIVSCCKEDACNSAHSGVNFSLYLAILCIAVGVTL